MTPPTPRPPRFARWLLRARPLGSRRAEVEADLEEVFVQRAIRSGRFRAGVRYFVDVLSVWRWKPSGGRIFRDAAQDLAYGLRVFRRSPGAVAVTIAGLGLAIGVSTSVFSLLNGTLMLRPGVTDPDSVAVVLRPWKNGVSSAWSYAEYAALRDMAGDIRLEAASQLATSAQFSPTAPDPVNDDPQSVPTAFVSGMYLSTLGARPALGRLLAADDDIAGASPVAVVGQTFWARRLGADPAIVGRSVWLSGIPVTVVGVAAHGFRGVTEDPPAFWLTLSAQRTIHGGAPLTRTSTMHVHVVARTPAGMTVRQAADRIGALAVAAGRDSTDPYRATGATLLPVTQRLLAPPARSILLAVTAILTAVALVVLLACVNVANLQLASAFARQREIGVRLALGASRGRIVRQLVTESIVLGWTAGALGLALTFWLVPVLARLIRLPITYDASPDGRVYAVLLLVSCVAGIGAGLAPARHGTRGDLMTPLKGDGPRLGPAGRPGRLRTTLIGVQAAVSVLLLLVASLAARAAVRAATIEVGYDPEYLMGVTPSLARATDTNATTYMTQALERIRGMASVRAAALTEVTPFAGVTFGLNFTRDGRRIRAFLTRTDAEYFSTLGLRTVRGRTYTASEVASAAPVAVVSETLARQLWGADDPIGKVLEEFAIVDRAPRVIVIGVVSDAVTARLEEMRLAAIFRPLTRFPSARILVRTTARPESVAPALRAALQPLDSRVRVDVTIVREGLHDAIHQPRIVALLAGSVAALALILAAIGIYGVTAFVTGQRTREIGIRLAVGASRADVLRLLLGDGLRPIVIGLVCGAGAALIAAQVIQGAMYGVTARDPGAFATATVILFVAAAAAVYFPTRRASRLNPVVVLRQS